MKHSFFTSGLIGLIFAAASCEALANPISGTELEIGPANSDQVRFYNPGTGNVPADYSGAFGENNLVLFPRSVAIGNANTLHNSDSLAVGEHNQLGSDDYDFYGGNSSLAVGRYNEVYGTTSLAVGSYNIIEGLLDDVAGASDSFVVGANNLQGGISSFISGENNVIFGETLDGHPTAAAALGSGLISKWSNSLLIGKFNDSTIPQLSGLLFAIGNGASALSRSNALEVYEDGTVLIKVAQGDIPMGDFGTP